MAAAEIDVKYVAHLARISLSPDEEQKLSAQLGNILGYIEKLKEADVSGVDPTAHAFPPKPPAPLPPLFDGGAAPSSRVHRGAECCRGGRPESVLRCGGRGARSVPGRPRRCRKPLRPRGGAPRGRPPN